jgi:hypothetical protein
LKRLLALGSRLSISLVAASALMIQESSAQSARSTDSHVNVVFSHGHETDPRDRGRPVILIAAALGVPAEVFREAFTHVHPAPQGRGGPTDEEARKNKDALLSALGKYGVTNDRLDEVSNHYRYVRSRGELWTNKNAEAYATVKNGKVSGFVVTTKGNGYSSEPDISVPGFPSATEKAQLSFSKKLENNGCVSQISLSSK